MAESGSCVRGDSKLAQLGLLLAAGLLLVVGLGMAPVLAGVWVVDTDRVSVSSDGTQGDGASFSRSVSVEGPIIVFDSDASDLVDGDSNGFRDVFAHDVATGVTTLVSVASDGTQADMPSSGGSVSDDGSLIVFQSKATNLVAGDTDGGATDVFMHHFATGTTTVISVGMDGAEANGVSYGAVISGDGNTIVYVSQASNLVPEDVNETTDVFAFDVATGITTLVSVASDGTQADAASTRPAVAGDGSVVAYGSGATNLVADDTNAVADVFAYDVATGVTTRVSVASDGTQGNGAIGWGNGAATLWTIAVSGDGSIIVYEASSSNLVVGDTNGVVDVFAFEVAAGATTRVSVASDGSEADGGSYAPDVAGDGSTIVYASAASNLVPGDTNGHVDVDNDIYSPRSDVFAYDTATRTTTRVSIASDGTEANHRSIGASVSGDGSAITYSSLATNLVLGDTNSDWDVFLTVTDRSPRGIGRFWDDDESQFERDIEWIAVAGITHGCNPPDNDMFCPVNHVTRGQMAAFLVRALGLTDDGGGDLFTDDDDSIFESDIDRMATAGITKGCNPPANDRFCPDSKVTRGQMAAFLVRALGYTDNGDGDLFEDDDDSIFETDIDKLATAGVTKGCNPPDNNSYCPDGYVTRGQMAAFLHRALGD
ncbi:MAG: hypothetical protein ACR2N7_01525 [Acidimicrobiia bacterium]